MNGVVDLIAAIALSPVFILQGRYVRKTIPKLPEPLGPRYGTEGSGEPLRLLIIGDSAAAGVGAPTQAEALSGQLVGALSERFAVSWQLLARTGLSTKDLVEHLATQSTDVFDVVVVSIGVNDLTNAISVRAWNQQLDTLVSLLRARSTAARVMLSELPPMHLFTGLPHPLRWFLGRRARRFNQHLASFAAARHRCEVVTLDYPVAPEYLATDGFHPGPRAYRYWGRRIADCIADKGRIGDP